MSFKLKITGAAVALAIAGGALLVMSGQRSAPHAPHGGGGTAQQTGKGKDAASPRRTETEGGMRDAVPGKDILEATAKARPTLHTSLLDLDLSRPPSESELIMAGQLGDPLSPTRSADPGTMKNADARALQERDNLAFGHAIQKWNEHRYPEAVAMFKQHLRDFPDSPWAAESELHIGCASQYTGQYDQCMESFFSILEKSPKNSDVSFKALIRVGNIFTLQGKLMSASDAYAQLLESDTNVRRRNYASTWIQLLSLYKSQKIALRDCVQKSLREICAVQGKGTDPEKLLATPSPGEDGFTAAQVMRLCRDLGFSPRTVRSADKSTEGIGGPWLAHYADQHFVAVFGGGPEEMDIYDSRVGFRRSISRQSFLNQWSGVAIELESVQKPSPPGLAQVHTSELDEIVGGCCGVALSSGRLGLPTDSLCASGSGVGRESPVWWINPVNFNMVVTDTPMWWDSPYGLDINFTMTFNSTDSLNAIRPFGDKWVLNYGSYLMEDPSGKVTIIGGNGQQRVFTPVSGSYTSEGGFEYQVTKTGTYSFTAKDLNTEITYHYGRPAGVSTSASLLTSIADRWGVTVTPGYNTGGALTSVTHSIGGTWSVYYNAQSRVDHITDPFSRTTYFTYDTAAALREVQDMGGLRYSYRYSNSANPVNATPATQMLMTEIVHAPQELPNAGQPNRTWHPLTYRFLTAPPDGVAAGSGVSATWETYKILVTHPGGGNEMFFFDGSDSVAKGWHKDRTQMASDPASAKYFTVGGSSYTANSTSFSYAVVGGLGYISTVSFPTGGSMSQSSFNSAGVALSKTDRLGNTHVTTVNSRQRPLTVTDPTGRVVTMEYETNGFDLKKVTAPDSLAAWEMTRNAQRMPDQTTLRDGTRQVTTWNTRGQLSTLVQKNSTGVTLHSYSYTYSPVHFRLQSVTKDSRTIASFTYDTIGRLQTATDEEGTVLTITRDSLDRITRITYPDTTREETVYLPVSGMVDTVRSRDGQVTQHYYNAAGQLQGSRSPQGFAYYRRNADGDITEMVDPAGNSTLWTYDAEHRITKETKQSGEQTSLTFNTKGQLTELLSPRGLKNTFTYDSLGRLQTHAYLTGSATAFPSESYTYDVLDRVRTFTDGTGTTAIDYNTLGQLISVDGPLTNDTYSHTWDTAGRPSTVTSPGSVVRTFTYDTNGRLATAAGPFGTATPGYSGLTTRLTSVSVAGGLLTTQFGYTAVNDLRKLSLMHNQWNQGGAATLSKFTLGWNTQQDLTSVTRELGTGTGTQTRWGYTLDSSHRLTAATLFSLPANTVSAETRWGYDAADNRLWEQSGSNLARQEWSVNSLNQLTQRKTWGVSPRPWVEGTVNEPAYVTLGGKPAAVKGDLTFSGTAPATTTQIQAKDRAGNTKTQIWWLMGAVPAETTQTITYDTEGNLLSDGVSTYEWDLRNRLTAIVTGTARTEYSYDGADRRVRVIEKSGSSVTSDLRFLWAGDNLSEVRDTASATVLERHYEEGHIDAVTGTRYLYTRDYLGSVREVMQLTGTTGNPTGGTLVARYDYSPWGVRSVLSGSATLVRHGYTGHLRHAASGLWLAPRRAYSPAMGRWISRDPLGMVDGPNLYAYVQNAPSVAYDPTGEWLNIISGTIVGGIIGGAVEWYNGGEFFGEGMARGAFVGAVTGATFGMGTSALAANGVARVSLGGRMVLSGVSSATGELAAQGVENLAGARCGVDWDEVAISGAIGTVLPGAPKTKGVNLASPKGTKHILYGDGPNSGGHKFGLTRLFNGKSKFPMTWSDSDIMNAVSDVVTSPASKWVNQTGKPGATHTKNGNPAKFLVEGKSNGLLIHVIIRGGNIITAFPPN